MQIKFSISLLIFCRKFCENCMFLFFFFVYIFNMFKILRSCLHYDVRVTSNVDGWYLFWYQWKEETYSYTVVANIRVQDVYYRKSRWRLQQRPLQRTFYRKWLRRTRVKGDIGQIKHHTFSTWLAGLGNKCIMDSYHNKHIEQ